MSSWYLPRELGCSRFIGRFIATVVEILYIFVFHVLHLISDLYPALFLLSGLGAEQ